MNNKKTSLLFVLMLLICGLPEAGMGTALAQTSQQQALTAQAQLALWQLPAGRFEFQQQKWIRGLKRPLQSSGYLQLAQDSLQWVTEKPVQQQVLLNRQGVQQQLGTELKLQPGSELIGQLMLAVMQQDLAFLQQHFVLKTAEDSCVQPQPLKAPLTGFYRYIALCGKERLQQIELLELSGNRSEIKLSPQQAAKVKQTTGKTQ